MNTSRPEFSVEAAAVLAFSPTISCVPVPLEKEKVRKKG